jgi:ubiquinone/menaquinone biosynthesis C-methylase UbiE
VYKKILKHGTLGKSYHFQRKTKKSLGYRLQRRTHEVIRAINTYSPKHPLDIIDLGSADGLMLSSVQDRFPSAKCIGIEYSRELIETMSDRRIMVLQGDIHYLPILDNSFDVAIATAVIEHSENPKKMLGESQRIIRKNGILILTSPDPFWEWFATTIGHLQTEQHHKVMNLRELSGLLQATGYTILDQKKFMLSPVGLPFECSIEDVIRHIGLHFLFANQLIVGQKN